MNITLVKDRTSWDAFVETHASTSFMQSWAWGVFEETAGHTVFRWFVRDEANQPIGACQAVHIRSRRGVFLYVPHGPIVASSMLPTRAWQDPTLADTLNIDRIQLILETLHRALLQVAKEHGSHFIRLNSSLPHHPRLAKTLLHLGYQQAPIYLTSENAAVLDITPDIPQLMAGMRKTTRYLVKKAQKEGVTVTIDTTGETIPQFIRMYEQTATREHFVGFSNTYLENEFKAFQKYDNVVILNAYHRASIEACGMIVFNKNSAFYHQGASNHPKIPASYLLQWYAILEAKKRGCRHYNFWGTYIPGRTPRSWKGLSLFKTGFGTQEWRYLPTMDYPLSPLYFFTRIYESLLRMKRGV